MDNFKELISGEIPVLVDFYATWCGPCRTMHPILEDLKKEVGESAKIIKLDIDSTANKRLAVEHNVHSVPTLIIFVKGKAVWRQSGVTPARVLAEELSKYKSV